MFGKYISMGFLMMLLLTASTFAADIKTVYIDVVGEGKFEVIYHRALSNATGAVIGGIIGAGIQSGIEAGKDADKAKELSPLITKEAWKTQFLENLNDKLESEDFEAVWVDDARDIDGGVVLKIYPALYGFRIVNTSTRMVSAYVAFEASFWSKSKKNRQNPSKEEYYITSKNQRSFEDLLADKSAVNSDLESTLRKAAHRLANKIIYSMKE